jgi:hypothetical protein
VTGGLGNSSARETEERQKRDRRKTEERQKRDRRERRETEDAVCISRTSLNPNPTP